MEDNNTKLKWFVKELLYLTYDILGVVIGIAIYDAFIV